MNEKRIKILHVTFSMSIGGAEKVIYNLIENTNAMKYDVSILCLDRPIGLFGMKLMEKGYSVHGFNRKPGFNVSLVKNVRKHIKKNNIDIIHCHQYTPYVYGVLGAAFAKYAVIFTEHGRFYPDARKAKRVVVNPLLNLITDRITAISCATRRALIDFENFPKSSIQVVYNGIKGHGLIKNDVRNVKNELGIPDNSYIIGTVARLDPIKNHYMMINALFEIQKKYPETYLVIVGDGPERCNIESLADKLKIYHKLKITGYKEDVYRYYNIMDTFLLTSYSEGTAMTLLEAMSIGIPCIGTDVGGNTEIVVDGKTGFIVPSNDDNSLAKKTCTLLESRALRDKMGDAAVKRFKDKFTVQKMVNAYEEIYEELYAKQKNGTNYHR